MCFPGNKLALSLSLLQFDLTFPSMCSQISQLHSECCVISSCSSDLECLRQHCGGCGCNNSNNNVFTHTNTPTTKHTSISICGVTCTWKCCALYTLWMKHLLVFTFGQPSGSNSRHRHLGDCPAPSALCTALCPPPVPTSNSGSQPTGRRTHAQRQRQCQSRQRRSRRRRPTRSRSRSQRLATFEFWIWILTLDYQQKQQQQQHQRWQRRRSQFAIRHLLLATSRSSRPVPTACRRLVPFDDNRGQSERKKVCERRKK